MTFTKWTGTSFAGIAFATDIVLRHKKRANLVGARLARKDESMFRQETTHHICIISQIKN
jgi:hypothetical protein